MRWAMSVSQVRHAQSAGVKAHFFGQNINDPTDDSGAERNRNEI